MGGLIGELNGGAGEHGWLDPLGRREREWVHKSVYYTVALFVRCVRSRNVNVIYGGVPNNQRLD